MNCCGFISVRAVKDFMLIKSKRIRWAGHMACIRQKKFHTGLWYGDLKERDSFEELEVKGRIIIK
jgi:hypothetical protein